MSVLWVVLLLFLGFLFWRYIRHIFRCAVWAYQVILLKLMVWRVKRAYKRCFGEELGETPRKEESNACLR